MQAVFSFAGHRIESASQEILISGGGCYDRNACGSLVQAETIRSFILGGSYLRKCGDIFTGDAYSKQIISLDCYL